MTIPVVTSPQADEDIRRIDRWWREHRPASPDLFLDEVVEGFSLLGTSPEIGHRYAHASVPALRRIVLRATRHHVYYVFDGRVVAVLAVWSAVRGRGPRLAER